MMDKMDWTVLPTMALSTVKIYCDNIVFVHFGPPRVRALLETSKAGGVIGVVGSQKRSNRALLDSTHLAV